MLNMRHYDPLRPDRYISDFNKYEFTHGHETVCVYDIDTMDFVKEISVGAKPDCHATSADSHYLYIACQDGLYCIDQNLLEVVKVIDTGHVYGTNIMPDGSTMLLHDAYGGIFIIKEINHMDRIHIHKRIDVLLLDSQKFLTTKKPPNSRLKLRVPACSELFDICLKPCIFQ